MAELGWDSQGLTLHPGLSPLSHIFSEGGLALGSSSLGAMSVKKPSYSVKFMASLSNFPLPLPTQLLSGLSLLSKHAQPNYLSADIFAGLSVSTRELLMITLPAHT